MSNCPAIPLLRRTPFPADLHPGSPGSRADRVLDFHRHHTAGEIVLAGDSLDLWHPPFPQWRAAHDEVLVRRAQEGRILRGHILTGPGSRLDRPLRHPDERLHRQRPPLPPADRRIAPTPPVRGPNLSTSERLPHA